MYLHLVNARHPTYHNGRTFPPANQVVFVLARLLCHHLFCGGGSVCVLSYAHGSSYCFMEAQRDTVV